MFVLSSLIKCIYVSIYLYEHIVPLPFPPHFVPKRRARIARHLSGLYEYSQSVHVDARMRGRMRVQNIYICGRCDKYI